MSEPRLNEQTYRLSTLPGPKHPRRCQKCGAEWQPLRRPAVRLVRWQECDHNDQAEPIALVLCEPCSELVIEQAPRLYLRIPEKGPWPGCMTICLDCKHRDGITCGSPLPRVLEQPEPLNAHFSGQDRKGKRVGWFGKVYIEPVKSCSQKEIAPCKAQ